MPLGSSHVEVELYRLHLLAMFQIVEAVAFRLGGMPSLWIQILSLTGIVQFVTDQLSFSRWKNY